MKIERNTKKIKKIKNNNNNNNNNNPSKKSKISKKVSNKYKYNEETDDLTENDMFLIFLINYISNKSKSKGIKMMYKLFNNNEKNETNETNETNEKVPKSLIHKLHFLLSIETPKLLNQISKNKKCLLLSNSKFRKQIISQEGGRYLMRLEKGDQPITGNDISAALDDISEILTRAQYTPQGKNLKYVNLLINMFRGDEDSLKDHIKYYVMPEYITYFPPSLNIKKIFEDFGQFPGLYTLYKLYINNMNQYKIEKGELDPRDIKPDQFEKLAEKLIAAKYAIMDIKDPKGVINDRMMYS